MHTCKAVGVNVEYGEPIENGEYRGTFKTVGDKEHVEIICLYGEEGTSIDKLAERLEEVYVLPVSTSNNSTRPSKEAVSVQPVGE